MRGVARAPSWLPPAHSHHPILVDRSQDESKLSMHVKDSMREHSIADISGAWCVTLLGVGKVLRPAIKPGGVGGEHSTGGCRGSAVVSDTFHRRYRDVAAKDMCRSVAW